MLVGGGAGLFIRPARFAGAVRLGVLFADELFRRWAVRWLGEPNVITEAKTVRVARRRTNLLVIGFLDSVGYSAVQCPSISIASVSGSGSVIWQLGKATQVLRRSLTAFVYFVE
jgi:hypothetical protein